MAALLAGEVLEPVGIAGVGPIDQAGHRVGKAFNIKLVRHALQEEVCFVIKLKTNFRKQREMWILILYLSMAVIHFRNSKFL